MKRSWWIYKKQSEPLIVISPQKPTTF